MCRAAPTGIGRRGGVGSAASPSAVRRTPRPLRLRVAIGGPQTSSARDDVGRRVSTLPRPTPVRGPRGPGRGRWRPLPDKAWNGSLVAGVRPEGNSSGVHDPPSSVPARPHGAIWLDTRTGQQSRRGAAKRLATAGVTIGTLDLRSSQALPTRPGGGHAVRTDMRAHQGAPIRLHPNPS